jgi:glycosyltransferase involved in cell wall biosynthesis
LAEAIKRLLKEPKLAAELTEKARALTLERFTVEPMVDSYFKLYGEVVGG